jgi:hypothetical protein
VGCPSDRARVESRRDRLAPDGTLASAFCFSLLRGARRPLHQHGLQLGTTNHNTGSRLRRGQGALIARARFRNRRRCRPAVICRRCVTACRLRASRAGGARFGRAFGTARGDTGALQTGAVAAAARDGAASAAPVGDADGDTESRQTHVEHPSAIAPWRARGPVSRPSRRESRRERSAQDDAERASDAQEADEAGQAGENAKTRCRWSFRRPARARPATRRALCMRSSIARRVRGRLGLCCRRYAFEPVSQLSIALSRCHPCQGAERAPRPVRLAPPASPRQHRSAPLRPPARA